MPFAGHFKQEINNLAFVGRTSDYKGSDLKESIDDMVGTWCCVCCRFLQGLIVGFILLQYSGDDSWISMGPFMQTKHLCVIVHYIINDEVGTVKLV